MKTAVSIPDEVFERAERLARRTNLSRSRLYTAALRAYLANHTPDEVTEAMDSVIAVVGREPDPFVAAAARQAFEGSEW